MAAHEREHYGRAATHVEVARLHADLRRIDPAHAHMYGADAPVI